MSLVSSWLGREVINHGKRTKLPVKRYKFEQNERYIGIVVISCLKLNLRQSRKGPPPYNAKVQGVSLPQKYKILPCFALASTACLRVYCLVSG